jgi:hypothetical protein
VLEIFGQQFGESKALGVGPHVRVKPRKPICGCSPQGQPDDLLIRVQHVELSE